MGTASLGVDAHGLMASSITQAWPLENSTFPVVTLDRYTPANGIKAIAFLEIDTEGMALEVPDGAGDTLKRTRRGPALHRGSIERLEAAGFTIDGAEQTGPLAALLCASRRD